MIIKKQNKKNVLMSLIITINILGTLFIPINANATVPTMPTAVPPGTHTIIEKNSAWKYDQTDNAPAASWNQILFDDSSWENGTGPFGYGERERIKDFGRVSTGTLIENRTTITYYVRKNILLKDSTNISKLEFRFAVNDGVVLYLNGKEIYRYNMPNGAISHDTVASSTKAKELKLSLSSIDLVGVLNEGVNVLAAEVHNRSVRNSDMYFDLELNATYESLPAAKTQDELPSSNIIDVNMSPGSDKSKLNFAWYSRYTGESIVLLAERSAMTSGKFPVDEAEEFYGTITRISSSKYSNKVTVDGLKDNTEYIYKVGNGSEWSLAYNFRTGSKQSSSFLFMGDPRIGASGLRANTTSWVKTLGTAYQMFPDTNMILTSGNQVNSGSDLQYRGFLYPEVLRHVPVAVTQGDRDDSTNTHKFNLPNTSKLGATRSGSDYYFVYNDILFLFINTNSMDLASHTQFIKSAVEQNPFVKWRVVVGNHSVYGSSTSSNSSRILAKRNALAPLLEKLGVDLVLMGNDYAYTRTYPMLDNSPQDYDISDEGEDIAYNPTGIVYITANSSTGSKYNALNRNPQDYARVRSQLRVPTFLRVNATGDKLEVGAYVVETGEKFDSYTVVKGNSIPNINEYDEYDEFDEYDDEYDEIDE